MSPRTQTALILSDWQVDLHDESYLRRTLALAKDLQPDRIVHVGDESDATTIGRWVRDTPDEVEGNLQQQVDVTQAFLRLFREAVPGADFDICHSNHLARFAHSIRTRLPGFRTLRALSIENLFGLDSLGIRYRRELFEVFPGVLAGHGHQWNLTSANQYQRGTAAVGRLGASLVCGHTHRPLLATVATGYNYDLDSHFYLNVGCSMDFGRAGYIQSTAPEWGHGVGLIEYNTRTGWVQPHLIVAQGGRFRWNGKWY
jgi:predicted phosphodiesterase